MAHIKQVYVNW